MKKYSAGFILLIIGMAAVAVVGVLLLLYAIRTGAKGDLLFAQRHLAQILHGKG